MILNLTQHPATPDQLAAGVVDCLPAVRAEVARLLTFDTLPTRDDVWARAQELAFVANRVFRDMAIRSGPEEAMIGGAPFLMEALSRRLAEQSVRVLFAFSRRESVEKVQPDGSVRKEAVFRHAGFVPACSA